MIKRYEWFLLLVVAFSPTVAAQNVTGYGSMEDPFLFLLREPAVHADLGLSDSQRRALVELNEALDATMLGSRANKTPEEAQQMTREVLEKSRAVVGKLLTEAQQQRLQQISYRIKGISFVLLPEPTGKLKLSLQQLEEIQAAVSEANEKVTEVSSKEYQGPEARAAALKTIKAARKQEEETIFAVLDDDQKREFASLIGGPFEFSQLGRVAFKAPQLIDSGQWVNSEGLQIEDLRGKVVALHFFAYG
jgi:hypothetical protein